MRFIWKSYLEDSSFTEIEKKMWISTRKCLQKCTEHLYYKLQSKKKCNKYRLTKWEIQISPAIEKQVGEGVPKVWAVGIPEKGSSSSHCQVFTGRGWGQGYKYTNRNSDRLVGNLDMAGISHTSQHYMRRLKILQRSLKSCMVLKP